VARERRLGARELEEIFTAFAEAMRELPPDVEAGWLDAQGNCGLPPMSHASCGLHGTCANCFRSGVSVSAKVDRRLAAVRAGDDPLVVQAADFGR
jgi:hypothetical protein